nr:unnamed protein product [Digitaria exilis]
MGQKGSTRMEAQQLAVPATSPSPANLPDDIHAEILVHLPAKSVHRFRSVCKAWRRITTDPRFLAAHPRRRPPEVLMYRYVDSSHCENRPINYAVDVALDALPVSGEVSGWRPLVSYPKFATTSDSTTKRWYHSMPQHCLLLDSCNGVLLFKKAVGSSYFLCNPVTRQWAELPEITVTGRDGHRRAARGVTEYAFYFHERSGEFRLLCDHSSFSVVHGQTNTWYVLSTCAAEPRHVDPHATNIDNLISLLSTATTPLALHGRVHWPPRLIRRGESSTTMEMVAFDTVSEKFHVMAGPPAAAPVRMKMFAMDGLLVAANLGDARQVVELWFLADYGAGRWEHRYRLEVPWGWSTCPDYHPGMSSIAAAADDQGNIILGNQYGSCVYNVRAWMSWAVSYVATPDNGVLMSRHVFRESLVQHPGFHAWSSSADLPLIHFGC